MKTIRVLAITARMTVVALWQVMYVLSVVIKKDSAGAKVIVVSKSTKVFEVRQFSFERLAYFGMKRETKSERI